MSENHTDCERFEALLLDGGPGPDVRAWHDHLEGCAGCREQWEAHQMLVATFAEETVPQLSAAFEAGLQRKIEAVIEVQPLRGWRMAAMAGYALVAVLLLGWVFRRFPLPSISLEPTSPWTVAVAVFAVPLTLWLTIGATRWLPAKGGKSFTQLSLL